MANGELCKHCGRQETDHILGKAQKENGKKCRRFVSEFKHKRTCPVLDCSGDCDARIRQQKAEDETQFDRVMSERPVLGPFIMAPPML